MNTRKRSVALGQECPSYGDMTIRRMGTLARPRVNSKDHSMPPKGGVTNGAIQFMQFPSKRVSIARPLTRWRVGFV